MQSALVHGILEFKACGKFGETLLDLFDETMIGLSGLEKHPAYDVVTTGHIIETLADTLWQSLVTSFPDIDSITIGFRIIERQLLTT